MESEIVKWVVTQGVGAMFGIVVLIIAFYRERDFTQRYQRDADNWTLVAQKIEHNYQDMNTTVLQVVRENTTALEHLSTTLQNRVCPIAADWIAARPHTSRVGDVAK